MTGGWRLALRGLARNRRRNAATGLAIALGYAGLVVLGGYATRIDRLLRTSAVYLQHSGHLAVWREGGLERAEARPRDYSFSPAEQETIAAALRADGRVEFWGRFLRGGGLAGNGCKSLPFQALGVEPEVERRILAHPEVLRWTPELGRPVAGVALPEAGGLEGAVSLVARLAAALHKTPSLAPPEAQPAPLDCAAADAPARIASDPTLQLAGAALDGALSAVDVQVVGVLPAASDEEQSALVAGLDTLQRLYDTDRVTSFAVFLRDPGDVAAVAATLRARLAAGGVRAEVLRYDDQRLNPFYVGTLGFLGGLVAFIGLLVVSVATLSVLNAMTLAILERAREIGTLRAMGFTRRQVLALFLREAAVLTALGVGAGLVLGLAAAAAVNGAGIRFAAPGMAGTLQLLVHPTPALCLALALLYLPLSVAATWAAIRRSVRTPIVRLLVATAA